MRRMESPSELKTTSVSFLAVGSVFAAMLAVSWRRWTSPIADSGREMDLPLRLLEGEVLYRDVHYLYPPLAPYFNALLYRIFGQHLDVLHAAGLFAAVLITALIYRIARRLLSAEEAAIAAIGVVLWCLFKPAGNLISPYSFAALYSTVFGLGALLLTLRYAERVECGDRDPRWGLLGAGVLIGLCAITKQEYALAAAASITATTVMIRRLALKPTLADLSWIALPAAAIATPVYGWLFAKLGWKMLVEDCHLFYTYLPPSLVYYNAFRTGLDRPLFSLTQIVGATAVIVMVVCEIVLVSDRTRKTHRRALILLIASILATLLIKIIVGKDWDGSPMRAMPFLLLLIIGIEIWNVVRDGTASRLNVFPPSGDKLSLFAIGVYSLAILARVALRAPSGGAFGGFFLPTPLIIAFYLLLRVLPFSIERWTGDATATKRARLTAMCMLGILLAATAVVFGVRYRRNFTQEIVTERGRLYAPRVSGEQIKATLRFIEAETRPGETIAVLPEGSDLAFLTGRRVRLRHQILIPGLMDPEEEQRAIEQLDREQVRYVFLLNRPMKEFGLVAFGRDFYPALGDWIKDHYRVVRVFGARGDEEVEIGDRDFFVKVLKRVDPDKRSRDR
jgi:4-amino-4-deoxy-L-arabinose transferase-like glycosyltransferase